MREIRTSGSVRGGAGDIPAYSAKSELQWRLVFTATIRQRVVTGIAVDLQHALKTAERTQRNLPAARWGIDINDTGRLWPVPGPIVARDRPEIALFHFAFPRI